MSNCVWTDFEVDFKDDPAAGQRVYDAMSEAFSTEWQETTEYYKSLTPEQAKATSKWWLGWLLIFCGFEISANGFACSGVVEDYQFDAAKGEFTGNCDFRNTEQLEAVLILMSAIAPEQTKKMQYYTNYADEGGQYSNKPNLAGKFNIEFSGYVPQDAGPDNLNKKIYELMRETNIAVNNSNDNDSIVLGEKDLFEFYKRVCKIQNDEVEYEVGDNEDIMDYLCDNLDFLAHEIEYFGLDVESFDTAISEIPRDAPIRKYMKEDLSIGQ